MKMALILCAALALGTGPVANAQGMDMPMKPASGASAAGMPLVDGEVRKVDLSKGLIVLRHGDIPNLAMPGMTMGFGKPDAIGRVDDIRLVFGQSFETQRQIGTTGIKRAQCR